MEIWIFNDFYDDQWRFFRTEQQGFLRFYKFIGSMVLLYMVTFTSTMDPMGKEIPLGIGISDEFDPDLHSGTILYWIGPTEHLAQVGEVLHVFSHYPLVN